MPVLKLVTDENAFEGLGGEGAALVLAYRNANAYGLNFETGSIDTKAVSAMFSGTGPDGKLGTMAVRAVRARGQWVVVGAPRLRTEFGETALPDAVVGDRSHGEFGESAAGHAILQYCDAHPEVKPYWAFYHLVDAKLADGGATATFAYGADAALRELTVQAVPRDEGGWAFSHVSTGPAPDAVTTAPAAGAKA